MLIRILFSIAAHLDVEIWQMDVKTVLIPMYSISMTWSLPFLFFIVYGLKSES